MSAIKPVLYRVETYVVPEVETEGQGFSLQAAINKIEDFKITNRLNVREDKDASENKTQSRNTPSTSNKYNESGRCSVCANKHKLNIIKEKTTTDEFNNRQFDNNNCKYSDTDSNEHLYVQKEFQSPIGAQDAFYPVRQFKKINRLMSIDERSENFSELQDLCHHGFKNGCTATIPSPTRVSDEIFKENWLHKMENLQQRDAILKEKEMNIQRKERELFEREKGLRIKERILNDKIRLVDEQLQHQKEMQLVEKRLKEAAQALSHKTEEPDVKTDQKCKDCQSPKKTITVQRSISTHEKVIKPENNEECDKKRKYPTLPRNHSSRQSCSTNINSGARSYANLKSKEQPPHNKIRFDDLNSTLSADNGDSSFVRTSERFNPLLYKKPYAFTRAVSERWTDETRNAVVSKLKGVIVNAEEKTEPVIEEDRIFRKLNENIQASQDKNTKFQNYGLVDCKLNDVQISDAKLNPSNEKKLFSYLDLAIDNKYDRQKRPDVPKDRTSWTEETDEWLQKKREAYNLAIKNSVECKENLKCNTVAKKGGKTPKKDNKHKFFTLFR